MISDTRRQLLNDWIRQTLNWPQAEIKVASADASFRRYFRVIHQGKTFIAMDAPPDKEDIQPFVDICHRIAQTGVHTPHIYHQNNKLGFLLLEDLGTTAYLDQLTPETADSHYQDAMKALVKLQDIDTTGLPRYTNTLLHDEMALMPEWFISKHLNIRLNPEQQAIIDNTFTQLSQAIAQQSTGFVHRDYHSRNLMITKSNNPGIIDFQDAVIGPLTYDLVSLLRDCYIAWPHHQVEQWISDYQAMAETANILPKISTKDFIKQVDLMGLQRHIKVLGIFARLNHRDNKPHYLNDLPLTLSYVLAIGKRHDETRPLIELFETLNIPETIGTVMISE